jgi:Transglycosylase SLT domain
VSCSRGAVRRAGTALSLIAGLMALAAALLPAGAPTPRFRPQALVTGLAAIPAPYLTWYVRAARTCPGLRWEVLAGIGTMESDNGRSHARGVRHGRNRKGAEGPMQFERPTFAEYAVRADRSARLSPYDPEDAIFTAARMLCADGGGSARRLRGAIFAYNHARWYVRDVLVIAARYTAAARTLKAACRPVRAGPGRREPGWHLGHWSPHPAPGWRRRVRPRPRPRPRWCGRAGIASVVG